MQQTKRTSLHRVFLVSAGALVSTACDDNGKDVDVSYQPLVAECAEAGGPALPADAWVCPAERTIECNTGTGLADPGTLYVEDSDQSSCADQELTLSDDGPFAVGTYSVEVSNEDGDALCTAQLNVVDTQAPTATSHTIQLWPPNHKMHSIAVSDCVSFSDACQGELTGEFIWASSDEPVNDLGDGNHEPDILIDDCGRVQVRAERQGPKDGRVYKLGVRVVDAEGNATLGECAVIVDHDQRGVQGADSGEAYRITFDGSQGGPVCDGVVDEPEPSDDGAGDDGADDGDDAGDDGSADGSDDGEDPVLI